MTQLHDDIVTVFSFEFGALNLSRVTDFEFRISATAGVET